MPSSECNTITSPYAATGSQVLDDIAHKILEIDRHQDGKRFTIFNPETPEEYQEVIELQENGLQE
ncbi:Fc.00g070970.m01.CDS01 [Cosmosporella sp. VM-42]